MHYAKYEQLSQNTPFELLEGLPSHWISGHYRIACRRVAKYVTLQQFDPPLPISTKDQVLLAMDTTDEPFDTKVNRALKDYPEYAQLPVGALEIAAMTIDQEIYDDIWSDKLTA